MLNAYHVGFQCLYMMLPRIQGEVRNLGFKNKMGCPADSDCRWKHNSRSSLTVAAGGAQIQNRLAHMDDNAAAIPSRELGKLLYGKDSVFARNPTPEQVSLTEGFEALKEQGMESHIVSRAIWSVGALEEHRILCMLSRRHRGGVPHAILRSPNLCDAFFWFRPLRESPPDSIIPRAEHSQPP